MAIVNLTEQQMKMLNNMCVSAQNVQMGTLLESIIEAINSGGGGGGGGGTAATKEYVQNYVESLKRVETITAQKSTFVIEGYILSVGLTDSVTGGKIIGEVIYISSENKTEITIGFSMKPENPVIVDIIYIPYNK